MQYTGIVGNFLHSCACHLYELLSHCYGSQDHSPPSTNLTLGLPAGMGIQQAHFALARALAALSACVKEQLHVIFLYHLLYNPICFTLLPPALLTFFPSPHHEKGGLQGKGPSTEGSQDVWVDIRI